MGGFPSDPLQARFRDTQYALGLRRHHRSGPAAEREYRRELSDPARGEKPVVLVFGTGWGISDVFYPEVHRILAPVYGPEGSEGYNHLSVRSAVAIILDRLFGL